MMNRWRPLQIAALALIAATPAWSADEIAPGVESASQPEPAAATAPVIADNGAAEDLASATLVDDENLQELRGGELVIADQTLVAITSGNVITGDYTAGSINFSDYSLSNFTGVGNFLVNTGGQVSLQTGMNLTINVGD